MLVMNWMSKNVVTVDEQESMGTAMKIMKEKKIPSFPVMRGDKLIGIITDRDIKKASASNATSLEIHELLYLLAKINIKDIMTPNPITVPPDYTVEEAAEILLQNNISGLPVVDSRGKLVGIITKNEIFKAMISLTGAGKDTVFFALRVADRRGALKEVTDVIRNCGGRMKSILTSYDQALSGHRNVYIRVFELDHNCISGLIDQLKEMAILRYVVDQYTNTREIYMN
ncbi:MAG: CBS domain-containing protein [Deltaproteobacteria bacterium]|nr:CBS domain-containing protein [Deltaproteobacteria bacterium]